MDIREVISFYHTARLRSVSKAAAYLELGQPTVTTHLQRLEKELGIQLFDRIKRPIRLTAEGLNLFELAGPVVQAVEQGLSNLKTQMDYPGHRGSFTIGAYHDLARRFLPPVIKHYGELYPEVQIKIAARTYVALIEMLDAGEVDLALVHAPEKENPAISFTKLFESPVVLVTPPNHPILRERQPSLEAIARWPLIFLNTRSYMRRFLERGFNQAGIEFNLAMEMEPSELIRRYVEIGMGMTIMQEFDIEPDEYHKMGVVDLSHLFAPLSLGIATQTGRFLPRGATRFIDTLLQWPGWQSVRQTPAASR